MANIEERRFTVEVPGLPVRLQLLAEEDIRKLAGSIARVANKMGSPFLLLRVLVTDCFQSDVNQLLQERSGLTEYAAARDHAHAIGITLWTRSGQGDLGFAVVMDATQIGPWDLKNPRCLTTVLHELIHVVFEERDLERLGEEEYCAVGDTRERLLDRCASSLLDEFDVDRLVDGIVGAVATKDDGQPWSLRELEEAQGVDWAKALLNGLDQMPRIIDDVVRKYRIRQMEIEELAARVIPLLRDLLTLISHTASIYMGTESWQGIVDHIKKTEAFQRFFREHLDSILDQLGDPQGPFEDSVQTMARSVEGIFRYCGLSFTTVPQGLWIAVATPAR